MTETTETWIDEMFPARPFYSLIQERGLFTDSQLKISQVGEAAAKLNYCPTMYTQKDMEILEYLIDNIEKFDNFVDYERLLDSYQVDLELHAYNNGGKLNGTMFSRSKTLLKRPAPANAKKEEEEGIDEICGVCLAVIGNEEGEREDVPVRVLPCNHFFHAKCVDPWLLERRKCPYCQQSL